MTLPAALTVVSRDPARCVTRLRNRAGVEADVTDADADHLGVEGAFSVACARAEREAAWRASGLPVEWVDIVLERS